MRLNLNVCGVMLVAVVATLMTFAQARADDTSAKEILDGMIARQAVVSHLKDLEAVADRIVYIQMTGVLAAYGDWPNERATDVEYWGSIFSYHIQRLPDRLASELVGIKRGLGRSKSLSDEDRQRIEGTLEEVERLLADSQKLYDLLKNGEIGAANEFIRSDARSRYDGIKNDIYTLVSQVEGDLGKLRMKAMLAK